jgi:hypothetical protein
MSGNEARIALNWKQKIIHIPNTLGLYDSDPAAETEATHGFQLL